MKIEVILNPAEIAVLPRRELSRSVCVVFDVLRATSSMVTGLHFEAKRIMPVATIEDAWTAKEKYPDAILGGERHGDPIKGFSIGNSPSEYVDHAGQSIISTTTNGTVALKACLGAKQVLAAALLNLQATVTYLQNQAPEHLIIVCAGTFETFALEDAFAAGALVDALSSGDPDDAALMVHALFQKYQGDAYRALCSARNGQALLNANREADIEWASRESIYGVVATMSGDWLVGVYN